MAQKAEPYTEKRQPLGKKLKMSPTELDVNYLFGYLYSMFNDLADLEVELRENKSLDDFSDYKEMVDVRKGLSAYILELKRYSEDIRKLVKSKDWLESVYTFLKKEAYPVAEEIDDYRRSEFRKHWKDEVTDELEETKYLANEIVKSAKIVGKLYKMRDVEPELIEKSKKKEEASGKPVKAAALIILVLGLSIGSLSMLSVMPVSTTGYSFGLTGDIATVNFEFVYVVSSSIVIGFYILGRVMKKW